jgi:catechol 2,3-dioxygenase-like lactoylglutathione lyase family enzyme
MLNHVSIGVRSLPTSKRFYDATLGALGYTCLVNAGDTLGYGTLEAAFWVSQTEYPVIANPESGLHLCFDHSEGLRMGGEDNGGPGLRPNYGADYYGAFLVDPDGYRIEAHCRAKP